MDFKIKKPFYYVGVQTGDFENHDYHLTLITEVDYGKRTWKAEDNKKPRKFTKELAEEMVICLGINDTFSVVVYSQGELTRQPFVKHNK